ncbi:MAG: hypothetical protein H0W81_04345 [Chloroflexi bacterium]|nr:hypothetical protein [Chloroflexota bacterium]
MERSDSVADELERRGVAAPAALLMEAHRPLLPLLRQGIIFLGPLLSPLLGTRRFGMLREALEDPAVYDRIAARLTGERRDPSR